MSTKAMGQLRFRVQWDGAELSQNTTVDTKSLFDAFHNKSNKGSSRFESKRFSNHGEINTSLIEQTEPVLHLFRRAARPRYDDRFILVTFTFLEDENRSAVDRRIFSTMECSKKAAVWLMARGSVICVLGHRMDWQWCGCAESFKCIWLV